VELAAVVRVFQKWDAPVNIITDSAHIAGLVPHLENACLREVSNPLLFTLLSTLLHLLNNRQRPYFIMHIRAHTNLPGPLVEGNRRADALTLPVQVVPQALEQARISHAFFHQNAKALQKTFSLTTLQAKNIIAACPDCQRFYTSSPSAGVNP
ncbi:POK6 protein, partial [Cepphus grylle]|nr:POK6 protein [Cepphus grylle]